MRLILLCALLQMASCAEAGPGTEMEPAGSLVDAGRVVTDASSTTPTPPTPLADASAGQPDATLPQVPADAAGMTCGAPGEGCCNLFTCNAGATCNGLTCATCGAEGDMCCGLLNQTCSGDLECVSGSCSTCGAMDEPCCGGDSCDGPLVCDVDSVTCGMPASAP